jgi:wobble nucleotide-excising tRNase
LINYVKNVNGYIDILKIINNRNVEFNKDTVYIRSNIKQSEDNPELFIYDEIQMTYDEYEKSKDKYIIEDLDGEIATLKSENDLLKGCIMELADVVFA